MARNVVKTLLTAADETGPAFKSATTKMERLKATGATLGRALAPLGAAAAVAGLASLGREALDSADKIGKLSTRLGASTEALSEYQHVAKLSGVTFETLTMGWQRMTRRVAEAANGMGEARGALKELNLDAKALNALAPDKQFERLADALMQVENPAERVRLAMKLFDSEGVSLIQTMQGGAAGIKAMRDEANDLGLTLDQAGAEKAAAANDAMTRLSGVFSGLAQTLAIEVAPAVTMVAEDLGELAKAYKELKEVGGWFEQFDVAGSIDWSGPVLTYTENVEDAIEATERLKSILEVPSPTEFFEADPSFVPPAPTIPKNTLVADHWQHEEMMQASEDVAVLTEFWAGIRAELNKVDEAAGSVNNRLREVEEEATRTEEIIGLAGETAADRLSSALGRAAAEGKLHLMDLADVAKSVFGSIFTSLIRMGVMGFVSGLSGGAASPVMGFSPSPIVGIPGLQGASSAVSGASSNFSGTLNVSFPQAVDLKDPVSRREAARSLYEEIQVVSKHHGPED